MKQKKIIMLTAFILIVLSVVVLVSNSTLAVDENKAANSITITNDGLTWLYGSDILGGGTIQFHKKIVTTSNGVSKAAYCTEATVNMAATTCNYLNETSAGQAYIIANGANSNVSDEDYFVTQMSLWWWIRCYDSSSQTVSNTCRDISDGFTALSAFTLDFDNPDNSVYAGSENGNVTGGVPAKMATLLNGALAAEKAGNTITSSISIDKSNTKLTKDGDYYKSAAIGVTSSNVEGNYTVTIASGAPSGTTITNTSGTSQTSFGLSEKFVVQVPAENLTSGAQITINISANGKSIVKGYEYDCSDSYQNLALVENISSNVADSALFSVDINSVKISKVDITNGQELPGASLTVHQGKCNGLGENTEIESWISTTEPHYIELEPGDYCLVETQAPAGYVLSTEKIDFTVTDGADTPTVLMENSKTELVISKQDMTTGQELPGATLVLKDSNGVVKDEWKSTTEEHVIYGLTPGKYTLTETIAPDGYLLNEETVTITINEDGTTDKVIMKNGKNEIVISKQDVTTGEELPGAELIIKNSDGVVKDKWTSTTEKHKVYGLEPGEYTLTETVAPEGYELSAETVKFTVNEDGTADQVVMKNDVIKTPEQVPTGGLPIIIAILLAIISLGSIIYYYYLSKHSKNIG